MNGHGGSGMPVIVIGGSAGAVEPAREIVHALPPGFPGAVFVILHTPPRARNTLADVLESATPLQVCQAAEGQKIAPSHIYVPAPDRHLLLANGHVHLTRGPKEGLHRPSINLTFRSAAGRYRDRVIGVLLSGMLDDGASGLWEIARQGGITIVQDPDDAPFPSMPVNALRDVAVDFRVPAAEIGPLLADLVSGSRTVPREPALDPVLHPETLSSFTCPECHGPLWEQHNGPPEFRCRVGHRFSLDTLLDEHTSTEERKLYEAILALEEGAALAEYAMKHDHGRSRESLRQEAAQLREHAAAVRKLLEERATPPLD